VLKSFIKALGLVAGVFLSAAACAVSMGNINVTTALGAPLSAEIDLASVSKAEKSRLSARLASPDVFKGAGIEYPVNLPTLNFEIKARDNGEPYVKVSSVKPVNEPFVSILVELSWSSGRLLREYTFLLDPPGFKPELPKPAEVKPVLSQVEALLKPAAASAVSAPAPLTAPTLAPAPAGNASEKPYPPMRVAAPVDERPPVVMLPPVSPPMELSERALPAAKVAADTIKVKRGDTLGKIATTIKPADISLERMLVALYKANADAFDGNMNRLRTGKILRVPEGDELAKVEQADARKEIRAQAADWNDYRQKLAAASGKVAVAEHAPKQEASGKISTVIADKTPPARESAKEVVRLSKGEAPGDKAITNGNARAMQDKLHALEEETVARSKTLKESNERIALLEKNISDMQHLIELKTKAIAAAKPEVKPEAIAVAASSVAPARASGVQAAKPAAPKVAQEEPSLLDQILGEPLYLAIGAALLLGLGAVGFVRTRRGKTIPPNLREETSHIVAPVEPSPDTGDFTRTATVIRAPEVPQTEDVDPISEAELFLNFGREAQAVDILKDALNSTPDNQRVRLKLMSIYANRKDVGKFTPLAQQVQASGDAPAWAEAAAMGRTLEPGNPLYGGDGAALAAPAPAEIAPQATPEKPSAPAAVELDLDLDFGAPAESAAPVDVPLEAPVADAATGLDFDLGGEAGQATLAAAAGETLTEMVAPTEAKLASTSVLDFDLGQTEQADIALAPEEVVTEPVAPETKPLASTSVLDFDLGFAASAPLPVAAQEHPAATNLSAPLDMEFYEPEAQPVVPADEQMLDVTAAPVTPASMAEEMAAAEASPAEMDHDEFVLDFPIDGEKPAAASAMAAGKADDILDLGGIDLNLDGPAAHAPEARGQEWYDVATKLDLARAYQEMGDSAGAREILEEVLKEGDAQQQETARNMIQQLL
jgi:pilus assembly protein FimV